MSKPAANKLRHFSDLDDLFDSNENELILQWVNELFELKSKQKTWSTRHRLRQKAFVEIAERMLDEDEKMRVMEGVEEKLEEEG